MEAACGGSGMSETKNAKTPTDLADALDDEFVQGRISNYNGRKAAVELRRLHEANQDLLKALNTILNICLLDNGHWAKTIEREAHEAIAKATGEKS